MKTIISLGSIKLKNPVLAASGTFGYAQEFKDFINLNNLGAIIAKTITLKPRQGNSPPRIIETASGMLNAIGLENEGLENFIAQKLPYLRKLKTQVIASIAGERAAEYAKLAKRLDAAGVSALELNLSCPNIKVSSVPVCGGTGKCQASRLIAQDAKATYKVVKAVRKVTRKAIIAKLTPNVTDIISIAGAAEDAGADAVTVANTFLAMGIDIGTRRPKLANITGGLSGPAIKPISLRLVWETAKKIRIPVIASGGIMNTEDALEFIIAGASFVEIGTANFVNPRVSIEIIDGIKAYMRKNRVKDIREIVGSIKI